LPSTGDCLLAGVTAPIPLIASFCHLIG
jgi:hypothetical protein